MGKIYNEPTIVVIPGATGDLSRRKLIPALFDLYEKGFLPSLFRVVGCARTSYSDNEYRQIARDAIMQREHPHNEKTIDDFLSLLTYQVGDVTSPETYVALSEKLIAIEKTFAQCTNKIFYCAISPNLYDAFFRNLAESGLTLPCDSILGWTRVLVEKPFGSDVTTAQKLDQTLGLLFKEEQIFRIDHYLGKSILQDVLMFRFSNSIFEPIWNNIYIEKVEITLRETLDIEGRGAFYDGVGALRDVGQNHILQMLALVAMQNPDDLDASKVRKERAEVLKALRPIDAGTICSHTIRGQYEGYRDEPHISPDSQTETYFKIKTYIDNDTWRGVPFYLESGKALDSKDATITVYFKKIEKCVCQQEHEFKHQNVLTFNIQPDEGIHIRFWAKKSGFNKDLEARDLSFLYHEQAGKQMLPDAYEYILFDAISGEQTLFTSTDEVNAAWKFITPIVEGWNNCKLQTYQKGGKGPVSEL